MSIQPYLIREGIDLESAERTGMAAYPFNWERIWGDDSEAYLDMRDAYDWIFMCEARIGGGCPSGESNRACLAVESRVATAVCEEHMTAKADSTEGRERLALVNRLLEVDHMVRDHLISAAELHDLACRDTYAAEAEWTPLEWAEMAIGAGYCSISATASTAILSRRPIWRFMLGL